METYNPKLVSLIVDGLHFTGFADGTFIGAERNEDSRIPHVGVHGDVTISESADKTGTITATLMQSSPSLRYARQLAKSGKEFPVQIVDANTQTLRAGGTQAVILRTPALEYGDEVASTEVSIFVADYDVE